MRILLVDNYDSYTYNIVNTIEQVVQDIEIHVVKNDVVNLETINDYHGVILSPGPDIPQASGKLLDVIRVCHRPLLGICLGHQAIGVVFGGELYQMDRMYHGVATQLKIIKPHFLFEGIDSQANFGLYHSWALRNLSDRLEVIAVSTDEVIMCIQHKEKPFYGVQFHPESYLSDSGQRLIQNWIHSIVE